MSESVPVRCPSCRRERRYVLPVYPCPCGAPVVPPLDRRAAPTAVTHRVWDEQWVSLRCGACGRAGEWPQPELGCPCGTVVRIPVAPDEPGPWDAVVAAARLLHRLGHRELRRSGRRPPNGIGLVAPGLLAHVVPGGRPASLRDVECLWLTAMTRAVDCVHFSRPGHTAEARARAEGLSIPLFTLPPTAPPHPANAAAHAFTTKRLAN
ncbi:hypothetical protein C3489_35285 [Streptomyces sp. Ru71]|uniref:hypothetical protein n=1 Tax=Streptomyces sp. Ru71 TaxID=2080746 RepID=UPI000CDD545B|nr:hypothetical protein [Streptomyces sp. Ru71]POX44938.1 hypothetical protein C3489_35285 [Streptomyces sp. Ru71]